MILNPGRAIFFGGSSSLPSLAQSSFAYVFPSWRPARRLLIIASGDNEALLRRISGGRIPFEITDILNLDDDEVSRSENLRRQLCPETLLRNNIWGIVVVSNGNCHGFPISLLLECWLNGIRVFDEHSFWEQQARLIDIDAAEPRWLWSSRQFQSGRLTLIRKRLFDLVIASIALLLTLPLMFIIAILIKCDSRGPALYRQERVGLRGRRFILYKFRSMRVDAEAAGIPEWAAVGDPRITNVGKFIRHTRIDELPQLLNVLRGEMSVVGPRPERPYFVETLAATMPFYSARHYAKPGITGWAQVNAPYGASLEDSQEKLRYDLYYIKHCSLWLDLRILLQTIRVVVLREGAR